MRKYVFGPIMSRRLGVSLGVDLIPHKTCPLDCIYCEARATTNLTMERKEYVCISDVLRELDETLQTLAKMPDYVTFSGSGEPTLNSGIGKVVDFLKKNYPQCKVCLLTNGLLLGDRKLQKEIAKLDLIIPSLDASCESEYQAINRPVAGETLEKLVDSLVDFRKNSSMKMALEIFVSPGINDSEESIARFRELVKKIAPDAVQINSLDRPGVLPQLRPAPQETLCRFAEVLGNICEVQIVKPLKNTNS